MNIFRNILVKSSLNLDILYSGEKYYLQIQCTYTVYMEQK